MKKGIILLILSFTIGMMLVGCAAQASNGNEAYTEPIGADRIADGTYDIAVTSSSSMFRIVDAQLTVAGDTMTVVMTMGGTGYDKIYMGTGEEALEDSDENCIYPVETAEGAHTYEVPVEALNQEVDCTALSTRKQTWYDRILVFQSAMIPEEAIIPRLKDGKYQIDAVLAGGAGKANIDNPTELAVTGGAMEAVITWSSPHYDLMVVEGSEYYPVNKEGNSKFIIPVAGLSKEIAVSAETTAMSQPYMIDYTLLFDASSIRGNNKICLYAGILILAAAGLGAYLLIRSKRNKKNKD